MPTQSADGYVWAVAAVVVAPYLFRIVQIGRRKKQAVKYKVRRLTIGLCLYLGGAYVWVRLHHSTLEAIIFGFLLGLGGAFLFTRPPERNRRIPAHVKRAVIARDLKGAPFNPKLHHVHHVVPYSKGGDNSITNLKVIPKEENLRRGAKKPRLRDLM
jgi:hypothetical protein